MKIRSKAKKRRLSPKWRVAKRVLLCAIGGALLTICIAWVCAIVSHERGWGDPVLSGHSSYKEPRGNVHASHITKLKRFCGVRMEVVWYVDTRLEPPASVDRVEVIANGWASGVLPNGEECKGDRQVVATAHGWPFVTMHTLAEGPLTLKWESPQDGRPLNAGAVPEVYDGLLVNSEDGFFLLPLTPVWPNFGLTALGIAAVIFGLRTRAVRRSECAA